MKRYQMPRLDSKFMVIALSVLILLYFIVLPLAVLIIDSVVVDGHLDVSSYLTVYGQAVNMRALTNTAKISILVMILSVLITFPLAWLIGRTDLPGRKKFRTILVASYMIPPYVGAIAWTQLLNPDVGYLNALLKTIFSLSKAPFNIYTEGGLIWVLTLFYSPFAFITISRAMEKMDPTLEEAARVSGASPLRTLVDVTLPLMAPSILAGGLLVFIAAGSCFGIPAIVGMAAALKEAVANLDENMAKISAMRDRLIEGLSQVEHSRLNGDAKKRLPGNVNFCFEGIEGESLLLLLDEKGIEASSGSACTSGSLDPSHVLLAIGLPHEVAHGSLRLTLCEENTPEQIEYIIKEVPEIVSYLRNISPVWEELEKGEKKHVI